MRFYVFTQGIKDPDWYRIAKFRTLGEAIGYYDWQKAHGDKALILQEVEITRNQDTVFPPSNAG